MVCEDPQRDVEMSPGEREHPVKALAAHRAHEPLGDRVRLGSPDRRPDHLHPLGHKHLVEGAAELGVPIVDDETEALPAFGA
jgi:hypothetical protein